MENNTRIFYEVRGEVGGNEFSTLEDAQNYLKDMATGFSKNNAKMTEENRAYWINASAKMFITKVTVLTEIIK